MPWHIPDDLRFFRTVTEGHPVIMGRRTFENIGKPLPNRHNIVLTRDADYSPDGVEVLRNSDNAPQRLRAAAEKMGVNDAFVIGGRAVYGALMPFTERVYMTRINRRYSGTTRFNSDLMKDFTPAHSWTLRPHNSSGPECIVCVYERNRARTRIEGILGV